MKKIILSLIDTSLEPPLRNPNIMVTMLELQEQFPVAYATCTYRDDKRVDFYVDMTGQLCCAPRVEQVYALGSWVSTFDMTTNKWSYHQDM